jgi:hypothetical protein
MSTVAPIAAADASARAHSLTRVESASLSLPVDDRSAALRLRTRVKSCLFALGIVLLGLMAMVRFSHEARLSTFNPAAAADARIPAGACVLTDVSSYTIVADRFASTNSSCPKIVDAIGTDYGLAMGRNALVGAARNPAVQTAWLSAFQHAQFVWLNCAPVTSASCSNATGRRIPWTQAISVYFARHFRAESGPAGFLFVRVRP